MRTAVMAFVTIAMLAAPAYCQERGNAAKRSGAEQKKSVAQSEKGYKAAQTPDTAFDPWRNIR